MTENILELARIETGKVQFKLVPVLVESVSQNCLESIRQSAQQKQLDLSYQNNTEIKTLITDEQSLARILIHLLDNAVKFTPEQGKIGLTVTYHSEEAMLCFTVWDTGIEIASVDMDTS